MKNSVNEVKYWINSKVWFDLFRFDGFISKSRELRCSLGYIVLIWTSLWLEYYDTEIGKYIHMME